jgi:hypothetical protein
MKLTEHGTHVQLDRKWSSKNSLINVSGIVPPEDELEKAEICRDFLK